MYVCMYIFIITVAVDVNAREGTFGSGCFSHMHLHVSLRVFKE